MANRRRYTHKAVTSIKLEQVEKQLVELLGIVLNDAARLGIQARIEQEMETRADELPADLVEQFHAARDRFELFPRVRRARAHVDATVREATTASTTAVTQCEHITVWDMDFDRRETIPAHKFNPAIHRRIAVEVEQCLN